MKKSVLFERLQEQLERTYHNATLSSTLSTDSDYESDLVEESVRDACSAEFADLKYNCPGILQYGEVFQWGRGGRTVAPTGIIRQRGGGSFSIRSAEDLELSYADARILLKHLTQFNDYVEQFCKSITDSCIRDVREQHAEEIKENAKKKRQHFSGVRYV